MALSALTTQKLAEAITSEIIDYIHQDERYAELMMELIPDGIVEKLGPISENLKMDLSFAIFDRIYLTTVR